MYCCSVDTKREREREGERKKEREDIQPRNVVLEAP